MAGAGPQPTGSGQSRPASPGSRKCSVACGKFAAGRICRRRPTFSSHCAATKRRPPFCVPWQAILNRWPKPAPANLDPKSGHRRPAPTRCCRGRAVRRPGGPDRHPGRDRPEREGAGSSSRGDRRQGKEARQCELRRARGRSGGGRTPVTCRAAPTPGGDRGDVGVLRKAVPEGRHITQDADSEAIVVKDASRARKPLGAMMSLLADLVAC